jgi:hypothetical protein
MIAWVLVIVLTIIALFLADALAKAQGANESLLREYRRVLHAGTPSNPPEPDPSLPAGSIRRQISWEKHRVRLEFLGFVRYEEYLNSELWRQTKQQYYASDYPKHCLVCGWPEFQLHHRTYVRLGKEELFDLVPLCREHHERLHEMIKSDPDLCVEDTHDCLPKLKKEGQSQNANIENRIISIKEESSGDEIPF